MGEWMPEVVWDAHACLPLDERASLSLLDEHVQGGTHFVSLNVGMDMSNTAHILRVIAYFRAQILAHPDTLSLVRTTDDVRVARQRGCLAVAFDLEGSVMLQDMPEMIEVFSILGVRQIHFAYNRNNSVAGGCHDDEQPLTPLGKHMVAAVNANHVLMDCSHTGRRSALDIMDVSSRPVIFSHTNPRMLCDHERCIDDDMIRACARTGGVVGISGFNRFFGLQGDVTEHDMVRHIEHVIDIAGIDHVGIGLDVMHEQPGLTDFPDGVDRSWWWPEHRGYSPGHTSRVYSPARFPYLVQELRACGYAKEDVSKIMGGNFLRVASQTWDVGNTITTEADAGSVKRSGVCVSDDP